MLLSFQRVRLSRPCCRSLLVLEVQTDTGYGASEIVCIRFRIFWNFFHVSVFVSQDLNISSTYLTRARQFGEVPLEETVPGVVR